MTTYSTEDVRNFIDALKAPDEFAFFRLQLLNQEAVPFGELGHAVFVQEQEETRDYYNEGEIYYVFKIVKDNAERFFKVPGYYSSYDGGTYNGRVVEVKPAPEVRYTWVSA